MHNDARMYVDRFATADALSVIEIGSRNINGTVRDLFPNASWTGLDLYPGPCVDVVCDSEKWSPESPVDLVICCEVFEHAQRWTAMLFNAAKWLKPGGRIVVTCAGPDRPPHSHHDGGKLRKGEYYSNISADRMRQAMESCGFANVEAHQFGYDTQASGVKL